MQASTAKLARLLVLTVVLGTFFLNLAWSVRSQSQTADEGFHLAAGYRYWQCGDFGINPEHPPLVKLVAAAPLWFGHVPTLPGACGKEPTAKGYGYVLGVYNLYGRGIDGDSLLLRARLAASCFALALALFCYLFARCLFGEFAGFVALLLVVFEPSILAHGALITTDIALSAFTLAAVFSLYRFYRNPAPGRLLITGAFSGLALAAKHSGVLVIPIELLLGAVEFVRWLRTRSSHFSKLDEDETIARKLGKQAGGTLAIWLMALCVLWSTYGFRSAARPAGQAMTLPLRQFITEAQAEGTRSLVLTRGIPFLARWHILPEAYLYGMADVLNATNPGVPAFLLGTLYPHGRWFYFPVAFLIKTTLGFLGLLFLAIAFGGWRDRDRFLKFAYLALPAAVFLGVASQSGLDIGFRHVLPAVAFLCILISGGAVFLLQRHSKWKFVVGGCLLAHMISSLHSFPNYLPYANEAWGGPSQTYRYLTDSNVDWGQELYQARDYLKRNRIQNCWISYASPSDVIFRYQGIACRQLSAEPGDVTEIPPSVAEGTFLLSASTVSGIDWEPGLNPYGQFQQIRPATNIAGGMLVYQGTFDLTSLAAATHIARCSELLASNQPAAALGEAKAAVLLTPRSVRAHLSLGHAFVGIGQSDAAHYEFETAFDLAGEKGREWYPIEMAVARRGIENTGPRTAR